MGAGMAGRSRGQGGATGKLGSLAGLAGPADAGRRIPLSLFGYVFVSVWQVWLHVADVPAQAPALPVSMGMASFAVYALLAVLFLLKPRPMPGWLQAGACIVGALAAVGLAFGSNPALVAACLLAAGAVQAVATVAWGSLYARLGMREAFACVLVTYIVDRVANGAVYFLPALAQTAIAPAALLLGGWTWLLAARRLPVSGRRGTEGAGDGAATSSALAKFALCLFLFNLAVVALLRLAPPTHGPVEELAMHAVEVGLAGTLLLYAARVRRPVRFAALWGCAFTLVTGGLLSVCLGLDAITLTLAKMSTGFLSIVVWLVAVDFARRGPLHPCAVVALLRAGASLPSALAPLATALLPGPLDATALAATLMWLLSLATLYFVTERELIALRLFEGLDAVAPPRPGVADIERRCSEVAERFGLTDRERQIMAMTCLGKSKAYVAEQLGVTESTVKSHVRNLYAKLGVHSKNELQALVGL